MATTPQAYIDNHRDSFIDQLKDFLRFPSVSAQPERTRDVKASAQWLTKHLADLGLDAELVTTPGHPIVKATAPGTNRDHRVLIYGHYDVQPEDPIDQWHTPPFEPTEKDGWLYCRGATDDKGQLFAHIKAVETLIKTQGQLPCDIVFLIEGEEECGADSLTDYIYQQAKELHCDAVIISDTNLYDHNTPAITYGLRGMAGFEVTIQGPARDVHSGSYGGSIANPAIVLSRLIAQCIDDTGRVTIPGFYDNVRPLEPWENDAIAKLNFNDDQLCQELTIPATFGEAGFSTLARQWARPTFEVNGFLSGYTGAGSKTIVPAQASAKITMRLVPDQDFHAIAAAAQQHLRSLCPPTVTMTLSEPFGAAPILVDANHPMMQTARQALRQAFNTDPVMIREGGSIPVVQSFSHALNAPVILMGFGLPNNGAHSPNERFHLDHFFLALQSSINFLQQL